MAGSAQIPAPDTVAQERTPVPIEWTAGWAPQQVWKFWRREKYLVPAGIRNSDRRIRILVNILTTLSRYGHTEDKTFCVIFAKIRFLLKHC